MRLNGLGQVHNGIETLPSHSEVNIRLLAELREEGHMGPAKEAEMSPVYGLADQLVKLGVPDVLPSCDRIAEHLGLLCLLHERRVVGLDNVHLVAGRLQVA